MARRPGSKTPARVRMVRDGVARWRRDQLATEEPLEIRLVAGDVGTPLAVTMRTPGADFELAAGFLLGEGVVTRRDEILRISYCVDPEVDGAQQYNIVNVEIAGPAAPDLRRLERHFNVTSACGVCGKASLDALELRGCSPVAPGLGVDAGTLTSLPARLRDAQGLFETTGGLHAAALFTPGGALVALREDVGRHNAVDKVIGWAHLQGGVDLADHLLMVSGRSSFEILQKAVVARIPVVCAVSAPSSLAVALARRFGVTLVGFLRTGRFNIYSGEERIRLPSSTAPEPSSA